MKDSHIVAIEPLDNVATALRNVSSGETVTVDVGDSEVTIKAEEDIQFGHKVALDDIRIGETVYKYGFSIGDASEDIEAGEWVHTHNVESNYGRGDLAEESA